MTLEHLSREQIGPAEVARRLEVSTAAATGIVDRLDRDFTEDERVTIERYLRGAIAAFEQVLEA